MSETASWTSWPEHVHLPLDELSELAVREWDLSGGAKLRSGDPSAEPCLRVVGQDGECHAWWTVAQLATGQLELTCRIRDDGGAVISLRASAGDGWSRAYRLQITLHGVRFVREDEDGSHVLGAAPLALEPTDRYGSCDVTVTMRGSDHTVWINGLRVLRVRDDDPLPSGVLGFGAAENAQVEYTGILIWRRPPWADDAVADIRHLVTARRLDPRRFVDAVLTDPLYCAPPAPPAAPVKFQRRVEAGIAGPTSYRLPAEIGSGPIPPNYIHSWGIDLRDIRCFAMDWGAVSPRQTLALDDGDRLYLVDSNNTLLKDFRPADPDWEVILASPFGTAYDVPPYQRVYLVLETSAKDAPRRLRARGVLNTTDPSQRTGAEEALLAADDLNYDPTRGPLFWGTDADGHRIPVEAPWGMPESIHHHQVSFPPPGQEGDPLPGDGWYLVGRHLTEYAEERTGYFSLLYYNERLGRVRLYLWNHDVTDATAYWVTVALQQRTATGFTEVTGALFMNDPRPTRWSTAEAIVPAWPQSKWSFVEIPMILYPMADDLPGSTTAANSSSASPTPDCCRDFVIEQLQQDMESAGMSADQAESVIRAFQIRGITTGLPVLVTVITSTHLTNLNWVDRLLHVHLPRRYRSVYEERFEPEGGLCNLRVMVCVRPLDVGRADLDFIGKATGQGVQISAADVTSLAEQAFDAFSKAGDWYGKGESIHTKILELIDDQKKSGASPATLAFLASLAAMGSSGWGAVLAAVAIWVTVLKEVFSDEPEPLRLAIELAIWGKITGVVATEKQGRRHYVYLPGRFSFPAAFTHGKIHTRYLDNALPRYDRPLGLFGFYYDPSTARLPIGQHWYSTGTSPWADCLLPVHAYDGSPALDSAAAPLERHLTDTVDRWLPLVINPWAEIIPVAANLRGPDQELEKALARFRWAFNDPQPFPDYLTPDFAYPALKDERILEHEQWFHWIQDVSPKTHIAREPADHSFPTDSRFGPGPRASIIVNSAVKTVKIDHMVFRISPLTDLDGSKVPRRVTYTWGTSWMEARDIRNGIWLDVSPVEYLPWVYFLPVTVLSLDGHTYGFAEQRPILPRTYRSYTDIREPNVRHGWRMRFLGEPAKDGLPWNYADNNRPFPIEDVLFCWDIPYFYYGRSRTDTQGTPLSEHTAQFRIPVDIHVMWKFNSTWNAESKTPDTDMTFQEVLYRSRMLQPPPS